MDADDALVGRQVRWAHRYDGYTRIAGGAEGGPAALERVLAPARETWRETGWVPTWAGVDLLRGWAFYLARADHHSGGYSLMRGTSGRLEWDAVLDRLREHPNATGVDVPPGELPGVPPGPFADHPQAHADRGYLAAKQARWFEAHVAPVNRLVDEIRAAHPGVVPYVDPDSGGVAARVLLLLEAPSRPAANGSGMLSADNADATAEHVWDAYQATGLPRTWAVHWNAVPWYLGSQQKIAAAKWRDVADGRRWTLRLIDLLPDLRVVLTLGNTARDAIACEADRLDDRGITLLTAPHPSRTVYNTLDGAREQVHQAFTDAKATARVL